jgi:hypothetical protein
MQIYHFICKSCGYETKLPIDSSNLDQILTDTNADFADSSKAKTIIRSAIKSHKEQKTQ